MSEETKGTTATEPEAAEPQNEPTQPAEALTAEAVSQMIAEAFQGFEQRQSEAKKLAEMTDQQRAETERDSYKQQLQALQKQVEAAQMQKTAREMLSEKGIHLPERLKGEPPKTGASGRMTKEQIFAIPDEGKRLQAIRDNMNLFE